MASQIVEEYGDERAAEALKIGIQQGIQQGEQKKAVEDACNMIRKKYPANDISEITGLPLEKVRELENQVNVKV